MSQENHQLATAVKQASDSILITDNQGFIRYVNPAFCHVTGYTIQEVIGENASIVSSGQTALEVYQKLWKTIQSGQIWRGELFNKKKNGHCFWEDCSIAPILDEQNQISGFVGIRKDMTEQKANAKALKFLNEHLEELVRERTEELNQAVQRAETANQAKNEFLAHMSHELRTPLHAIKSFANLIFKQSTALMQNLEKITEPEILTILEERLHLNRANWESKTHLWLMRIVDNEERQLLLVNNLLDLAKMESSKTSFRFTEEDIFKIISKSIDEMDPLFKEKFIQVTLLPKQGNTQACVDAAQFCAVIKNLLSNALKFTPKNGAITISMEDGSISDKLALVLHVQDTGQGIPEAELEHIFSPFVQSSLNTSHAGGSGLGLAICREIMMAHGGTIQASSPPEGGALFTIILPIKRTQKKPRKPKSCAS